MGVFSLRTIAANCWEKISADYRYIQIKLTADWQFFQSPPRAFLVKNIKVAIAFTGFKYGSRLY